MIKSDEDHMCNIFDGMERSGTRFRTQTVPPSAQQISDRFAIPLHNVPSALITMYGINDGMDEDESFLLSRILPASLIEESESFILEGKKILWFSDYFWGAHFYGVQCARESKDQVVVLGDKGFKQVIVAQSVLEFLKRSLYDPRSVWLIK